MTKVIYALLIALLAYSGFVLFLYTKQRNFIYIPDQTQIDPAEYGAPDMKPVVIAQEENLAVKGWYQPPQEGKPVIVLFHGAGNAIRLNIRNFKARPYLERGYGFLITGYRGFTGNPGKPTEKGLYRDGRAWLAWLTQKEKMPWNRIVVYGQSLGSGVAVQMAAEHQDIAALVLESPFTSMTDLARMSYPYVPVNLLLKDRFDNLSKILSVNVPVLFLHGEQDEYIPHAMSRKLYEAAQEPKTLETFPDGGHDDLDGFGASMKVLEFLKKELR